MNLLVTGAWKDVALHRCELERMGHTVTFMEWENGDLPVACTWVEGIVCNALFLYHPISLFPNLKYIQLVSAGYDRVDMQKIREKEIEIHNAKGVYSIPMAEFAVAGVLEEYKKLGAFRDQQRKHIWKKNRELRELSGKTVAIIGCGDVGRECAKRFKAFDTVVVGVNRTVRKAEYFDQIVGLDELDEVLQTADVVVVTLALSEETKGLVKGRLLKPGALMVNISRGAIVDVTGTDSAILDVFENEPLDENDPLWDKEGVLITPHNSFVGEGNQRRLWDTIRSNLETREMLESPKA